MNRTMAGLLGVLAAASVVLAGCTQAAPAPTSAPAAPTKAAEPTKPAGAAPAPTKAAEPTKAPTAAPTAAPATKVDFPQKGKSVSVIIPWAPGGGADVSARLMAAQMEKELGVPFQVVNKPGAGTQLGLTDLVNAKPDGYTISQSSMGPNIGTYLDPDRKATYGRKDFTLLGQFAVDDNAIFIKSDLPYKDLKGLVEYAKANPGKVKAGSAGILSGPHVTLLGLQKEAGIKLSIVQFDSAGATHTALLGGHVDIVAGSPVPGLPHVKSGAEIAVGVANRQENPFLPGVKTLEAQGYKVYFPALYGFLAPAGTPKEIVGVLTNAIKKTVDNPDLQKKLQETGMIPKYLTPDEYSALWTEIEEFMKPAIELAKLEQQ